MNKPDRAPHRKRVLKSRVLIPILGLLAVCAVVAVIQALYTPPPTTGINVETEATASLTTIATHAPQLETKPPAAVKPDPRFVPQQTPQALVSLTPEARSMALAMENKYRCAHCCGDESTPRCLPGLDGESYQDTKALTEALRKSLGTLPNDCYVSTALPKVIDPKTPAELMNLLYEDLLKRPDAIKLRMLFIIAETEGHPLAASALDNLKSILKIDHQQDWPRWEQAVTQVVAHEERGMRSENCRIH